MAFGVTGSEYTTAPCDMQERIERKKIFFEKGIMGLP
jgi:hypothetical protein